MATYKLPILADGLSASMMVATDSQKRLISTADLTCDSITLPSTSDSSTGIIAQGSNHILHSYGSNNLFLGNNAGNFSLTGINNVGIGRNALLNLTSGSDNFAIGYQSLGWCESGNRNVCIGTSALARVITGHYNTGIGHRAGFNCTGERNVFIGGDCGYRQTSVNNLLLIHNRLKDTAADELAECLIVGTFDESPSNQKLRVNGLIEVPSTASLNLGYSDVDGSWRFIRSSNNLLVQRRQSGSWVTKHTFSA